MLQLRSLSVVSFTGTILVTVQFAAEAGPGDKIIWIFYDYSFFARDRLMLNYDIYQ